MRNHNLANHDEIHAVRKVPGCLYIGDHIAAMRICRLAYGWRKTEPETEDVHMLILLLEGLMVDDICSPITSCKHG